MKQAMEDVSEVLSSVVKDVDQAVSSNINGAQLLHELLSAPWLHALLKIYECLLKFQRLTPSPVLPYASGLSYEIMTVIHKAHCPSPEARELCSLLSLPDIQALLSSHDSVAQADYEPVLPPLPDELPEDEEAMRIVCLVKNNQPLSGEECRRTVGEIHNPWSSLHRFTLDRLIPARSAQSGEELRVPESEASLLLVRKESRRHPFLPRYESTGSCYLSPPTVKLRKKELNQSAPSVLSPATCTEEPKPNGKDGASTTETNDDYSYPPPPIPAYSFSLPNSPVLYKKSSTEGQSRNIPTPGKTPSCPGINSLRAHTTPSSPATRRSTREQGVNTLPTPERQHGCQTGQTKPDNKYQEESLNHLLMFHCSSAPHHNGCHNKPKHTQNEQQQQSGHHTRPDELTKQCSVEELRSTVQMVASSIEHNSQDVRHLGESMVAASEMITNSVEENAQALNLLAEVVDKLQGLIVAKKHQESSPPLRNKQYNPPPPPPRVSSLSPKMLRKPRTPYPHPLSPSPSFIHSSSSSSTSSGADDFTTPRSSTGINGGSKRMVPASQRAGRGGSNGQGATIRKDEVTGDIYIARVIHGGLADRSGLLHPGDLLVEVNGNPVVGLDPEQVIHILANSQGTILFKVIPNPSQVSSSQAPVCMRAMVDYSPLQDSSIPCPDAGMAFSRGDLLQVVDQSDGQWWQARKLPCVTFCAGLIPSASMLKSKQREQWWCQPLQVHTCIRPLTLAANENDPAHSDEKHAVTDLEEINFDEPESDITDGIYLAGFRRSFRVWKRISYRKRRQSCTTCSPNSNALSTPYEEVVLYQRPPQENHRLIILVGASGVGVNELRKRLIKLNPSTFQGPVPHTTRPIRAGEQTGREYHFVTKELFEYMVCNHRFVEYGECKGHLYGISTDAIVEVLKRGRMCIIDAEPHSIQLLRTKKFKPYVIFIKPPSPERLRQTRRDARIITNYAINRVFTEEDFVELEETSQLIEAKYRQFFDSVLVNCDLQDTCIQLCSIIQQAQDEPQWIPVSWGRAQD